MHGEIIYEGGFCDGAMHGEGRLLFDTGETWAGQFWKVIPPPYFFGYVRRAKAA